MDIWYNNYEMFMLYLDSFIVIIYMLLKIRKFAVPLRAIICGLTSGIGGMVEWLPEL
jgi:hypothetical protein